MKKYLKVLISLIVGGGFLWLAFRNVEFAEIAEAMEGMSWGWVVPFSIITLFSHFIRALRWRMLFHDKDKTPGRFTLFTGVMFGYFTNIALPRAGEIARPIYVARQIDESNSKIIGTVVLERFVDVASMLIIMVFVGFFLISDPEILSNLFGLDVTDPAVYSAVIKKVVLYGGLSILLGIGIFSAVKKLSNRDSKTGEIINKIRHAAKNFFEGVMAVRELRNWPLFIFYTALIWMLYITMTYIPFYAFDLQITYDLSFADAVVLTMVSAVGIAIPTPGGIGSYHLLITYCLFILYAVPEPLGLAFATVGHAATIILYLVISPLLLAGDKYLVLKREAKKTD